MKVFLVVCILCMWLLCGVPSESLTPTVLTISSLLFLCILCLGVAWMVMTWLGTGVVSWLLVLCVVFLKVKVGICVKCAWWALLRMSIECVPMSMCR